MPTMRHVGAELPTSDKAEMPRTGFSAWLFRGDRLDEAPPREAKQGAHPWYMVLWLTGVDYFSTLGYQPGIALLAAGALAPVATLILVAVTLTCAVPIYAVVCRKSFVGQGSIALLENLISGWKGKIFVLVLLGFATTDFVITMTLSAADSTQHALENPYLKPFLGKARVSLTLLLLLVLAWVFLKGFKEAINVAVAATVPFLALNLVVLVSGLYEIVLHPDLLSNWRAGLMARGDWSSLLLASALLFPRLALGLSGFETGVSVMPLVRGDAGDSLRDRPLGRIRNTRKLLVVAASIMAVYLLLSSFVTTLLIPPEAYQNGGPAAGRAIAYLAHRSLGPAFGTIYDIWTIVILWFAGASAMAGLLHLVPRYLPRFGMAPLWVRYQRPVVLVLFVITVVVTLVFGADVEAQAGAYATGVLVLMLSAAVAAALGLRRESPAGSFYCWMVSLVFAYTLADNVIERPDGVIISAAFILLVLTFSAISRARRATELRIRDLVLADEESSLLWDEIVGKKVYLVPIRGNNPDARAQKRAEIHKNYAANGSLAFVHVSLLDNRSEFLAWPLVTLRREAGHFVIDITRCIGIANTIAFLSELIDPIGIFLGLSRQNLVGQALRFLLLGEGETGLMVYAILLRYWEWTPQEDVRPLIFLMSD